MPSVPPSAEGIIHTDMLACSEDAHAGFSDAVLRPMPVKDITVAQKVVALPISDIDKLEVSDKVLTDALDADATLKSNLGSSTHF